MFEFGGRMARFPSGIHRPGLVAVWLRIVREVLGRLATVRAGEAWGGGSRELRSGQGGPCGSAGSVPHRRIARLGPRGCRGVPTLCAVPGNDPTTGSSVCLKSDGLLTALIAANPLIGMDGYDSSSLLAQPRRVAPVVTTSSIRTIFSADVSSVWTDRV